MTPDSVWIAITTSLANYVDRNAEAMRSKFVKHDGQKELVVYALGNIMTANYDQLVKDISQKIEENTIDDIRTWMECDFTTSTELTKIVSRIVLMGAVKNYFSYKMVLKCGVREVTLDGTVDDWKLIRTRVAKLATYNLPELTQWSEVLEYVMDEFVAAFETGANKEFWNRIAHRVENGSGPTYLEGWILAFIPFTDSGKFVLNPLSEIKKDNVYGSMDTNDVPKSVVEVPVKIDDNGRMYDTLFYAGEMVSSYDPETTTIEPVLDWALVDVTAPPRKVEVETNGDVEME